VSQPVECAPRPSGRPGPETGALRGFAFEPSGFGWGYDVLVTLDQPGDPAPRPAKLLYAPPVS
jgi:hypothetical protein